MADIPIWIVIPREDDHPIMAFNKKSNAREYAANFEDAFMNINFMSHRLWHPQTTHIWALFHPTWNYVVEVSGKPNILKSIYGTVNVHPIKLYNTEANN